MGENLVAAQTTAALKFTTPQVSPCPPAALAVMASSLRALTETKHNPVEAFTNELVPEFTPTLWDLRRFPVGHLVPSSTARGQTS